MCWKLGELTVTSELLWLPNGQLEQVILGKNLGILVSVGRNSLSVSVSQYLATGS